MEIKGSYEHTNSTKILNTLRFSCIIYLFTKYVFNSGYFKLTSIGDDGGDGSLFILAAMIAAQHIPTTRYCVETEYTQRRLNQDMRNDGTSRA